MFSVESTHVPCEADEYQNCSSGKIVPESSRPHQSGPDSDRADRMRSANGESRRVKRECCRRCSPAIQHVFRRRADLVPLIAIVFSCALLHSVVFTARAQSASEYQVKAAFLYNFAKFVEWPASAFGDSKQSLDICVFGRDPFGRVLEDSLLGKTIGERRTAIRRAIQLPGLAGCQVVFVAGSEGGRAIEAVNHFRRRPVLLVGESEGFAAAGGTIQFMMEEGKVRFVINPDAADRANLKISSKLLALAKIVHDSNPSIAGAR